MDALEIRQRICKHRFRYTSEGQLQDALEKLFISLELVFEREVRLNAADRPDFMIGSIAVEVKTKGSRSAAIAQMQRYAEHDRVSEIILVTSRAVHLDMPAELRGKPVHVAHLLAGAF
ncbi:MAG TPA: hypothetical protein VN579_07495 [Bryobacteraceae bacterium]|nr:hypothetical protein [Bryobacteraceae bacterium]